MIAQHLPLLNSAHIVLASGSPRRKQILQQLGLTSVEVVASSFAEDMPHAAFGGPEEYVVRYATEKANEVNGRLAQRPDLVIGSDTVIALDGRILEKPADAAGAARMLSSMSGRTHEVWTGVAMVQNRALVGGAAGAGAGPGVVTFAECTSVTFAELERSAIESYVATGEPLDKAGSYGIQGMGGSFVTGIVGDYYNVVGFPLHRFAAELLRLLVPTT